MKLKNLLIILLVFIDPNESLAIYKPIYSHFGYPTETFITPTFSTIPAKNLRNDFSLNTSTILNDNKNFGVLLSADVYNRSFIRPDYKMVGIVPTKSFVENRLALCWLKKISDGEYFYVGPSVRTIEVSTGSYMKPNYEQFLPVSKSHHNMGFLIGYSRIVKEKLAIASTVGMFGSKYNTFMYNLDLNYVVADHLALTIGSADGDVHGGIILINNWGRIGYKGTFVNDEMFHAVSLGLALNY